VGVCDLHAGRLHLSLVVVRLDFADPVRWLVGYKAGKLASWQAGGLSGWQVI